LCTAALKVRLINLKDNECSCFDCIKKGNNSYISSASVKNNYELKEFKTHGWDNKHDIETLKSNVDTCFSKYKYDVNQETVGYRSIHYIVTQEMSKHIGYEISSL
jgi:hypothetical protein